MDDCNAPPGDDGLADENLQLRTILDRLETHIFTKDQAGRYTYANDLVCRLFGQPLENILGRTDADFFDLDKSRDLIELDRRVMTSGLATSGEEEGKLGAENLLKRMSDTEKKNTLLVINLDNLIVGDKLYFNSGVKTPEAVRKLTRDRALAIARSHGIAATTNPGLNKNYPKGTGCCNDAEVFDKAGIAVLSVEATNWNLGNKDGYQQRAKTAAFPAGNSWHDVRLDNQQHIDKALPGRIERRCRDVMRIMLPLVKELAKAS